MVKPFRIEELVRSICRFGIANLAISKRHEVRLCLGGFLTPRKSTPYFSCVQWASFGMNGNKKPANSRNLAGCLALLAPIWGVFGGEGGIRTRGGMLSHTRFPGVRLKPLIHLSCVERHYILGLFIVK